MSEQIQKVGNYILFEKIAVGGMAEVYLAKMISSDRLVAVKKILPNHSDTQEYIKLFKEEVKVSLCLHHGNIVNFVDYIYENSQLYLVMEFVNGLNLKKLVGDLKFKKTKFNFADCLFIISEVAAGLDHAHRAVDAISNKKLKVIHRDINPHNIMITFDGCIKIIDFGIAKADLRNDVTKIGTIKGKFSYMSPEQASAGPLDGRSDIYALGVVMWELLTGRRLHEGKNDLETLKKIRAMEVPKPRDVDPRIPQELENLVMKALAKDPDQRYQKASDFRFALNQVLSTMFPDFRPSDFTDFISGMYSELINSRIEKLTYLSKVRVDSGPILSPFDSPQSPANLNNFTQNRSLISSKGSMELPEGFETKSFMIKKKKENLNFQELKKESNIFATEVKTHTKQKAANFFQEKQIQIDDQNDVNLTKILENSILWNLKHLALIIIVMYAGYSFQKQFYSSDLNPNFYTSDLSSETPASMAGENHANPAIPGRDKKEDFAEKFINEMKASGKLSFAKIDLENGPSDGTNIFINGKIIYQKAPIRKLPVYADQVTTITAYNPVLKIYDERKVVVPKGKTMSVKLILRPYKTAK